MRFSVSTWNINSVRLRIDLVGQFLAQHQPDVLCLQETKCVDDAFPAKSFRSFGYPHIAISGQKGYHGVAIVSRHPFAGTQIRRWCDKQDARHIAVRLSDEAGPAAGITIHDFYIPAGGDIPDPAVNEKFAHKLTFLDELEAWGRDEAPAKSRAILVGDLNVAPYVNDVWSHKQLLKIVSHTPVETEALERLRLSGNWTDAARHLRPEPEKLFTWWSYRSPDWRAGNKGRRLDHIWLSQDLVPSLTDCAILTEARGWDRPSDHVPVTSTFDL